MTKPLPLVRDHLETLLTDVPQSARDLKPKLEKIIKRGMGYSHLLEQLNILHKEGRAAKVKLIYTPKMRQKRCMARSPKVGWKKEDKRCIK